MMQRQNISLIVHIVYHINEILDELSRRGFFLNGLIRDSQ